MIRISDQNLLTQYIMAHQYDYPFNLSFVKNVQKMFKVYCKNIADQKYKYKKKKEKRCHPTLPRPGKIQVIDNDNSEQY